jgi:hypothetical protein
MGSTLGAIQSGGGFAYQVVVAIEGYEYLITNGSTSAAITAWAGTDWTQALGGLSVRWPGGQRMTAWRPDLDVPSLSFCVQPDAGDTFGRAVFGSSAGYYSPQDAPADNDDTQVTVLSTSAFPTSGAAYMGTERFTYASKTGTTLLGCTRGTHAPFRRNPGSAQRCSRYHPLGLIGDGIVIQPHVTTAPRKWRGRWVGVWIHRVVGGVLDVRSEAQCVFAGRITSVRDEADGLTWVECDDARGAIRDCTLLGDQWSARVREGIRLRAGDKFDATDSIFDSATNTLTDASANTLTVVAGTPGANEIAEGTYTLDELANEINDWLLAERAASRIQFTWSLDPREQTEAGLRSQWAITDATTTALNAVKFYAPWPVLKFLGWESDWFVEGGRYLLKVAWDSGADYEWTSPETPYRIYVQNFERGAAFAESLLNRPIGSFVSQRSWLPPALKAATPDDGAVRGVVQLGQGGPMVLAKWDGATRLLEWRQHDMLDAISGVPVTQSSIGALPGVGSPLVRADVSGDVEVRQVVILHGRFDELLTTILASTGTYGYNHAGFDALPAQLGASIPWEVLGTGWVNSTASVAEATAELDMVIEKPTKLVEVIGADLAARLAFVRWKNGGLRLATWATPTSSLAEHVLDDANKASPSDTLDQQRTVANETDEYLVNQVKLEYNRVLSGGYRSTTVIRDQGSMYEHGSREPVTISLRNTFAGLSTPGASLDYLVDQLSAQLRMFSQPLRVLRRTIALPLYEGMAPGDVVSITDSFARDPATGARGLAGKAGLVVGVEVDWGGYEVDTGDTRQPVAQVDVVVFPRDRIYAYAPAAEFVGSGYTSGTKTIATTSHAYSESTDALDATWFAAGDKVRIVEIDPDNPAAPQTWTDTVASQTGANIVLTSGLASVSSSKRYRVISDVWSVATTTQQAKTYQADDADGLIASGVDAHEYGLHLLDTSLTEVDGTTQVDLYAELAYGKGAPLDVGYEWDATTLANNLVRYRSTVSTPHLYRNVLTCTTASARQILAVEPLVLHPGELLGSMSRSLVVRPWLRRNGGSGSVRMWVSLCARPPVGLGLINDGTATLYGLTSPYSQQEWSTSSTTWGAGAAALLDAGVVDPATGIGYLVIEGEQYLETRGLAEAQLVIA